MPERPRHPPVPRTDPESEPPTAPIRIDPVYVEHLPTTHRIQSSPDALIYALSDRVTRLESQLAEANRRDKEMRNELQTLKASIEAIEDREEITAVREARAKERERARLRAEEETARAARALANRIEQRRTWAKRAVVGFVVSALLLCLGAWLRHAYGP